MIRINLLPVKAAKRRADGQRQLLIGAAFITVTLVGIISFHSAAIARISSQEQVNNNLTTEIAKLKAEIGDYDEVKAQREQLLKQRDAIKKLQANRSGPVWMMREFSDLLTVGKGPTINKEQYEQQLKSDPNAAFNPNWDPRRAWLLEYTELAQNVTIKAAAKSDEDVAEFLKRKSEYLAYRNERNQLLEEQKELLQALPKSDDMEQFIESVQAQIELAGLTKVSSTREAAIPMDLYTKIPIRMTAVGTYHQINQFFKSVGDLKRIVNIEDLKLEPYTEGKPTESTNVYLKASFVATTFQYLEKKGGPGKPHTTTITAGAAR